MAISGKGISAIDALDSISGASTTDATITASDKILFQDVDDGDNVKSDTVQGILDLASGGSSVFVQMATNQFTTTGSTTSSIPIDSTIPQNTEGYELVTQAITPTNASNKLVIEFGFTGGALAATNVVIALFQDSTADALSAAVKNITGANYKDQMFIRHEMTAGTTSSTTFKIRIGTQTGTLYWNQLPTGETMGGVISAYLTIKEIAV